MEIFGGQEKFFFLFFFKLLYFENVLQKKNLINCERGFSALPLVFEGNIALVPPQS